MAHMYFIAVVLPSSLNEKILVFKNYMKQQFSCLVALNAPAHITLIPPFWMEEDKEEHLIADLAHLSERRTFILRSNNFSAFKPRTIFIALHGSEELNELKSTADHYFIERKEYKMKIDTRPFHPHITIATRDLTKKDFHIAWPHFEQKKFSEEWIAEGISLLRHNKKNWDVIYTSQFKKI
jgi:2'-5' RNA ligase